MVQWTDLEALRLASDKVMSLHGSRRRKYDLLAIKKGYFGVTVTVSIRGKCTQEESLCGLATQ